MRSSFADRTHHFSQTCDRRNCKNIIKADVFTSNRNQESFKMRYSTDCTSQNVIYLIECKRCNMQYIGQTNQQVSKRMNSHRFDINTYGGQSYATNIALHFNSDSHSLNDFRFLPIDAVKNEMDRLCKETYCSCEVLNKLKSRGFRATLSTYDFSTLYTTLPHNFIKDKLVDLIERTFQREGSLYIACNDRNAFFTSDAVRNYNLWSCQKVCEALTFLLDNIYIRFGSKLNRQIVGIPMGTNCAPLVADLYLFCYERDFMLSLSEENQSGVIEAFNSTSRYLDDLLNIDNNFFDSMVNRIYPSELQLNKANMSDAEASFLDLHLSISDGFVKN